jgi:phenylacetate-CoA ligase
MSTLLTLYHKSPVWLQTLGLGVYGGYLRYLRYGRLHSSTLRRLMETQWLDGDAIQTLQLTELNALLRLARSSAIYERAGLPDHDLESLADLEQLPFVKKAELRRPKLEVVPAGLARSARHVIHTGGTTGTPLKVYCTRQALQRNYAFFERFKSWTGFQRGDRVATFAGRSLIAAGQSTPPYWRTNHAARTRLFSSYHLGPATATLYLKALREWGPQLIDSYPSNLELLARHILSGGGPRVSPRAIVTSSETLTPGARATIESAFDCRILDYYGSAEMAALITQCTAGSYHVNPEFGVVELIKDGRQAQVGEVGEIVATGFTNPATPLVRYRTGDAAVRVRGSCSCGRAFPVLERIIGRMDDVIVTPDGRHVGRLDPIFKAVEGILETQIVQDRADHLRIEVVPGPDYREAAAVGLINALKQRVGSDMIIDVELVQSIPRTAAGKRRTVVNLILGMPGQGRD